MTTTRQTRFVLSLSACMTALMGCAAEADRELGSSADEVKASPDALCTAHTNPDQLGGLASCDVAQTSLVVEIGDVAWEPDAVPWQVGSWARLPVRYENWSETRGIHYPGANIVSSDPRVETTTEAHGLSHPHPDLYMLAACQTATESGYHGFTVKESLPSGTKITLTLHPLVATGDGIDSCDGVRDVTVDLVVP